MLPHSPPVKLHLSAKLHCSLCKKYTSLSSTGYEGKLEQRNRDPSKTSTCTAQFGSRCCQDRSLPALRPLFPLLISSSAGPPRAAALRLPGLDPWSTGRTVKEERPPGGACRSRELSMGTTLALRAHNRFFNVFVRVCVLLLCRFCVDLNLSGIKRQAHHFLC